MDEDVKVFHLIAEPIEREFAPGFMVNCWGYNGSSPGPTIEAVEGDRVRILVTNHLNEPTTVHWHGLILPNGMDGVAGLTQKSIPPGETFKYEFTLKQNGTYMYHPHSDEMYQIAMGMVGFFIIHPKERLGPVVDRDYAFFLHEWHIPMGAKSPLPLEMVDFNVFTFNSVLFPTIDPVVAKMGERVRIRFGNLMMGIHPIHIHGYEFTVTRRGAGRLPLSAQYTENTVSVAPGETRDIEFIADNPGDWAMHCHKTHHVMNQMVHDIPNLTGIDPGDLNERIKQFYGINEYQRHGGNVRNVWWQRTQNAWDAAASKRLPYRQPGTFRGHRAWGDVHCVKGSRESHKLRRSRLVSTPRRYSGL
jgi:FtsP/CotA-like multicopper oxidase with cupredoxin domain